MELILVYAYFNIDDKKKSYIRSLIYWAANCTSSTGSTPLMLVCFLTTFWKAGNKLNASLI
jgi:hypothetical protein